MRELNHATCSFVTVTTDYKGRFARMQDKGIVMRISVDDATYKKFRQLLLKEGATVSGKLGAYVTSYVKKRIPNAAQSKTRSSANKKNPSA